VSEAARGRAPGLLVGAAEEMERLRAWEPVADADEKRLYAIDAVAYEHFAAIGRPLGRLDYVGEAAEALAVELARLRAMERERDAYRAALQSIADFRPKSEQPAWGGPYEQIAAHAKQRARDALCGDAPAAGGEATGDGGNQP
jgi:hypothetical protein